MRAKKPADVPLDQLGGPVAVPQPQRGQHRGVLAAQRAGSRRPVRQPGHRREDVGLDRLAQRHHDHLDDAVAGGPREPDVEGGVQAVAGDPRFRRGPRRRRSEPPRAPGAARVGRPGREKPARRRPRASRRAPHAVRRLPVQADRGGARGPPSPTTSSRRSRLLAARGGRLEARQGLIQRAPYSPSHHRSAEARETSQLPVERHGHVRLPVLRAEPDLGPGALHEFLEGSAVDGLLEDVALTVGGLDPVIVGSDSPPIRGF